ncbi:MAG: hypothetical protein MUO95_05585 [Methanoregula sp.]|nr:hypothetical protein [Methanoregula sp.]
MRKEIILLSVIFIGVCLVCGCVTQSKTTSTPRVITPSPGPQTEFSINEPASDGVLRISVIRSSSFADSLPAGLSSPARRWISKIIVLNLENLRSDRTIHLETSDFRLINTDNHEYLDGYFYGKLNSTNFDLYPGQREQLSLAYDFKENTDMSTFRKLIFDFSCSNGKMGPPLVYFLV